MSNFQVLPNKDELLEDCLPLARQVFTLSSTAQLQPLLRGAIELLWGQVEGLNAHQVVDHLANADKLQNALQSFRQRANGIEMWADQFTGSPDGEVQAHKLPTRR